MCRSANEAGGPQRCSTDARARFGDAGAEVAVLELLEERMAAGADPLSSARCYEHLYAAADAAVAERRRREAAAR